MSIYFTYATIHAAITSFYFRQQGEQNGLFDYHTRISIAILKEEGKGRRYTDVFEGEAEGCKMDVYGSVSLPPSLPSSLPPSFPLSPSLSPSLFFALSLSLCVFNQIVELRFNLATRIAEMTFSDAL